MFIYTKEDDKTITLECENGKSITVEMNRIFRKFNKKEEVFDSANEIMKYSPEEANSYRRILYNYHSELQKNKILHPVQTPSGEFNPEGILETIEGFEDLDKFSQPIIKDTNTATSPDHLLKELPAIIMRMVDRYLDEQPELLANTKFNDPEKAEKKGTILFSFEDSTEIIRVGCYTKFVSFIFNSELKPNMKSSELIEPFMAKLVDMGTIEKLYKVITTNIYASLEYNQMIWKFLRYNTGKTPDAHGMIILFNVIKTVFPSILIGSNPITYLVVVIKMQLHYLLITNNADNIVYSDEIFNDSDEVDGSISNTKEISMRYTVENFILKHIIEKHRSYVVKVKDIYKTSAVIKYVALPFISRLLNINYTDLTQLNTIQKYLIGVYVGEILATESKLYMLGSLLKCYTDPSSKRVANVKSIKTKIVETHLVESIVRNDYMVEFVKEQKMIETLVSEIVSSKYIDIKSGDAFKLESKEVAFKELSIFYTCLFNGEYESLFERLRETQKSTVTKVQ